MVSILYLHLGNDFKLHWNETLQFLAFYSSEGRCTDPPSKTGKSQITKIVLNAFSHHSWPQTFTAHSNKAAAHTALPDVENTFTCTSSHWPSHSPVSQSKTGSIALLEVGVEARGCWWTSAPLFWFPTCSNTFLLRNGIILSFPNGIC